MNKITSWCCEGCGAHNAIEHAQSIDVYGMVEMIRDDHLRLSASCQEDNGLADVVIVRISDATGVTAHEAQTIDRRTHDDWRGRTPQNEDRQ